MLSYPLYKWLHLCGIFFVLMSLGGIGAHIIAGGRRDNFALRKPMAMLHGLGLLMLLISGFGALAKLNSMASSVPFSSSDASSHASSLPTWAAIKLAIWFIMGSMPVLFYRAPKLSRTAWFLSWALAATAAALAIFKPL